MPLPVWRLMRAIEPLTSGLERSIGLLPIGRVVLDAAELDDAVIALDTTAIFRFARRLDADAVEQLVGHAERHRCEAAGALASEPPQVYL